MPSPDTRWGFSYEIQFSPYTAWTDITSIVDSRETSINDNGVSKDLKSSIAVCSIKMKFGTTAKLTLQSSVMSSLLAAKEAHQIVKFRMTGSDSFTGKVDLSNLSQTNSRIPGWITLECEDNSYLLEEDIPTSFEYPNVIDLNNAGWAVFDKANTSTSIIHQLLYAAGYTIADIDSANSTSITKRIKRIVYDSGDERTYRDLIDTILFEFCAVYTFTGDGKFLLKILRQLNPTPTRTVSAFLNDKGINSKGGDYQSDGVKVTWSSLSVLTDANVYNANLSTNRDEDGILIGEEIQPESYWPGNGDIEDIWQEFDASFLDREYLTKKSRLKNKDLSIISVKNPRFDVIKDPDLLVVSGTPVIEPLRARVLFYNQNGADVKFLKSFSIRGDVLFRNRENTTIFPADSTRPDAYTSEFLYDTTHASEFAIHLHNFKKYGDMSHTWSEDNIATPLFQVVTVSAPGTLISTMAMVVSITKTFPAVGVVRRECSAIGMTAFNSQPVKTRSIISGAVPMNTGPTGDIGPQGEQGAAGNVYKVEFESTNGLIMRSGAQFTTIIAHVYDGTGEITEMLSSGAFSWTRTSQSPLGDVAWNNAHSTGYKVLDLTPVDFNGYTTFSCEIREVS